MNKRVIAAFAAASLMTTGLFAAPVRAADMDAVWSAQTVGVYEAENAAEAAEAPAAETAAE